MQKEMPLKQIIDAALSKIGSIADSNTVIGEPIALPNDVTIIPFSRVTVGFASGGTEFSGKNDAKDADPHFAGGNGAGVSVTPLGFIVVENGSVRLLDLKHDSSFAVASDPVSKTLGAVNSIVDRAPELIEKIKDMIGKKDAKQEETENDVPTDVPTEE